jgi:hypothetical protein
MFEEERPALAPLPPTGFEYYRIVERRVHVDAHIEVDGAYYSAPPRYAGTSVVVHVGRLWLRVIDPRNNQCIREHVTTELGRRRTLQLDLPKQTPPEVQRLVAHVAGAPRLCTRDGTRAGSARVTAAFRTVRPTQAPRARARRSRLRLGSFRRHVTSAISAEGVDYSERASGAA